MAKNKKGAMAGMLMSHAAMGRLSKPSLHVSASMDSGFGMPDDSHYHKQEVKRLSHEIKGIKHQMKNWNPKAVADQAFRSLRADLLSKRARLAESKARMSVYGSNKKATKGIKLKKSDEEPDEMAEETAAD